MARSCRDATWAGALGGLGISLLPLACATAPDPLDAAELAELARSRGDARGSAASGDYGLTVSQGHCDCPASDGPLLCQVLTAGPVADGTASIVHDDGFALLRLGTFELTGPVDADGTVTLGSVSRLSDAGVRTFVLGRFAGTLEADGFTGELTMRLVGEVMDTQRDCGGVAELVGHRF